MFKKILILATSFALTSVSSGAHAGPEEVANGFRGPAAEIIKSYMKSSTFDCNTLKGESKCNLFESADDLTIFYAPPSAARNYVVAFLTYQEDRTGNAESEMALVRIEDSFCPRKDFNPARSGWQRSLT